MRWCKVAGDGLDERAQRGEIAIGAPAALPRSPAGRRQSRHETSRIRTSPRQQQTLVVVNASSELVTERANIAATKIITDRSSPDHRKWGAAVPVPRWLEQLVHPACQPATTPATYQLNPGCAMRLYLPNCSITWTEDWSACGNRRGGSARCISSSAVVMERRVGDRVGHRAIANTSRRGLRGDPRSGWEPSVVRG